MKGSGKKQAKHTCCSKKPVKSGVWSIEEDEKLKNYILSNNGHGAWTSLPALAGLNRCGKSCRLRWINYLRPELKHGEFSKDEAKLIIQLQKVYGNKWSDIAKRLPGRTDNDIKNFWNSKLKKKKLQNQISLSDDVVGNNYPQAAAGGLYQNNPNNYRIMRLQQNLYLNLFHMMKAKYYDPAVDQLISGPTNESLNVVQPPAANFNDKGKGVLVVDDSDQFANIVQPSYGGKDSFAVDYSNEFLNIGQPSDADGDGGSLFTGDSNVAQPVDADGGFLFVDHSTELQNVVQPIHGDGDSLVDASNEPVNLARPTGADGDFVFAYDSNEFSHEVQPIYGDGDSLPVDDSIELANVDLPIDARGDSLFVNDSNELANVAPPIEADGDSLVDDDSNGFQKVAQEIDEGGVSFDQLMEDFDFMLENFVSD